MYIYAIIKRERERKLFSLCVCVCFFFVLAISVVIFPSLLFLSFFYEEKKSLILFLKMIPFTSSFSYKNIMYNFFLHSLPCFLELKHIEMQMLSPHFLFICVCCKSFFMVIKMRSRVNYTRVVENDTQQRNEGKINKWNKVVFTITGITFATLFSKLMRIK